MSVRRTIAACALLAALACLHSPAAAATRPGTAPARTSAGRDRVMPSRSQFIDIARRIDINDLNMFITNLGAFGYDLSATYTGGLFFPNHTAKTALYAGGLWIGAKVGSETRVAVAEYDQEYRPGRIVGGAPEDPTDPRLIVYKVRRWTGVPSDSAHEDNPAANPALGEDPLVHHSWSEYVNGAKPFGAPTRIYRLDNTATPAPGDSVDVEGPDVAGDQMLWCVYNDADPASHHNEAGSTAPLGVEVRQTAFAFDAPDPLGGVLFLKYVIANKGSNTLDQAYAALWSDPDLGTFTDDLAGCDTTRALGYCFNGQDADGIYGANPPALGVVLLEGPGSGIHATPMTSFDMYVNGTDPLSASESYNYLSGLGANGAPIVNPITGDPTNYFLSGDPFRGGGWLDSKPSDRRMLLSSGPFHLAPGERTELLAAVIVAQGSDRFASLGLVRCFSDSVRAFLGRGLTPPFPDPAHDCPQALSCPRPASWWGNQSAAAQSGPALLSTAQVQTIAQWIGAHSLALAWAPGAEVSRFLATLNPPLPWDARQHAKREFAAYLANVRAAQIGLTSLDGPGIGLNPLVQAACSGFPAKTIGELARTVGGGQPMGPSPDSTLAYLESQPLGDPGIASQYESLASCLEAMNDGVGVGATCSTPLLGIGPPSADARGGLALAPLAPNPLAGDLVVTFTLPAGRPASLELVDIAGRRLLAREVGSLGPGTHTLALAPGRLPAGVYVVRLSQGGRHVARKAVVIR